MREARASDARSASQRCAKREPAMREARASDARSASQRCAKREPAMREARASDARSASQRCAKREPAMREARASDARSASQRCAKREPAMREARASNLRPKRPKPRAGASSLERARRVRPKAYFGTSREGPEDVSRGSAYPRAVCQPLRASAPPMISISSVVIAAWRARLKTSVRRSIISAALPDAASIAVMRAPCSDAIDSSSAR
jgi:hypothetical protein